MSVLQGGSYQGVWRRLVLRFKEVGEGPLGELLGQYLTELAEQHLPRPEYIAAVPTSRRGWRWRGYGAPETLAEEVVRRWGCARVGQFSCPGKPRQQKSLSPEERARNPLFFACESQLSGSVLLIDDVVTSGATLKAASQALLLAGAREVWPLVLAGSRSPSPSLRLDESRRARRATNSAR